MIIDSHCHLNYEPMSLSLKETIDRANRDGVKYLLTISTEDRSYDKILEIISNNKCVYGTYGIHPHEAKNDKVTSDLIIKEINHNKKVIAIGETGLDFYYNYSDKNEQLKSLEEHINASIDLNIPLIIHSRNAEKETIEVFESYKNKNLKILMHCFTGSKDFAKKLLKYNAFFSASGIITFKNAVELQNTFSIIPLDRLLIETDSPYLAPVPNRGKKNEPSFIKFTAEKLAQIKKIKNEDLIKATSLNFNTLFK